MKRARNIATFWRIETRSARILSVLAMTIIISALIFLVLWNFVAPSFVVRSMKKVMAQNCITCRIAIDHPSLGFWPGRLLKFDDVLFYGGEHDNSEVQVIVDRVEIAWRPQALLHHQLILQSIKIVHPVVVLSEGLTPSRFKKDEKPAGYYDQKPSDWTFEADQMSVEDGSFTYRRTAGEHHGEIHATKLTGQASRWGTTSPDLKKSVSEAEVSGQIEKSAHGLLKIAMPPLETEKQHIDVDLTVRGLKLEELTYFPSGEGVGLKGELINGHAQIFVRDRRYNAKTHVEYKDLQITVEKSSQQSEIARFFMGLIADFAKHTSNLDRSPEQQTSETDGERVEGESMPHFILRGLKESVMKQAVPMIKPGPPKAKK